MITIKINRPTRYIFGNKKFLLSKYFTSLLTAYSISHTNFSSVLFPYNIKPNLVFSPSVKDRI